MTAVGHRCHMLCMHHLVCLFVILYVAKETLLTEFRLHSASQRISFQWAETEFPYLNTIAKNLTNWTWVSVLLTIIYCRLIVTLLNAMNKWIKSQFSSSFIQLIRWFHFRKWGSKCNSFCIKWAVRSFMQGISISLAMSVLKDGMICFPPVKVTTGHTVSAHAVQILMVEIT